MASTVLGAMIRGILAWVFFYVALAHLFVYWNWDATDGTKLEVDTTAAAAAAAAATTASVTTVMDESQVQAILAEIPLKPLELIELLTDTVPEEVVPLNDEYETRIQELKQNISRLEAQLPALETQLEEWNEEKKALEEAISELRDNTEKLQHMLTPNTDDDKKKETIWKAFHDQMERYENETLPDFWFVDGSRHSEAAQLWTELMEHVTDLSMLSDVELERTMDRVMDALDDQIKYSNDISWKALSQAFRRTDYPAKTSSPIFQTCPVFDVGDIILEEEEPDSNSVQTTTTTQSENDDDSEFPTKHDVLERLDELRGMRNKAYEENEVPLVLAPGRGRLATLREQLIQQWTQKAKEHVEKALKEITASLQQVGGGKSKSVCLDNMEQAKYILEAGLLALERNRDLNTAILNAIVRQGFDPRTVILDAVFQDFDNSNGVVPSAPSWMQDSDNQVQLTWRQVLDQPLMKKVTNYWLPFLVDGIGGYNDALDTWLDQVIPHHGEGDDEVLKQLLELAGKYPLPAHIRDYWFAYSSSQRMTPQIISQQKILQQSKTGLTIS